MKKIKKVTLIGLGAMGAFFAPKLETYLGKDNFRVLADGKRRERLLREGVTLNGVTHHFTVISPEEVGDPADLIIIAVKDTGLTQAILDIRNQVGEDTQILSVMNGIDSEEKVAAVYGWERVLYSFMRVSIEMKDGIANFDPDRGKVYFGEAKNAVLTDRVKEIQELFEGSKIAYHIEEDMI
jgi:2-dehydropantoate 2-reductase